MRRSAVFLGTIFLLFTHIFFSKAEFASAQSTNEHWKNFHAISWRGDADENIRYARQMGYDYIGISRAPSYYINNQNVRGLNFYIDGPAKRAILNLGYSETIEISRITDSDPNNDFTQAEIDFYNRYMVWKSYDPFPYNLATGWWFSPTNFMPRWDFQQQAVIDLVIEQAISIARSYENKNLPFTFAGYIFDVVRLQGDFCIWNSARASNNEAVDLSYWTGVSSGLKHGTITHEYATYEDGFAAFLKTLKVRMKQEFPNSKLIFEPWVLYGRNMRDEYIYQISSRADRDELTPDLLLSEAPNTDFVDNANNFNSGVNVTRDMVGNSQRSVVGEPENRLIAAKAGINGAWYDWFGRWGVGGNYTMPDFQNITEVYPRLKLIRCLPNWDNLNNVPLADRSWDGSVYRSANSFASSDVMYSRHPKTGKLFAVFLTTNGVIRINSGETVTSVSRTNDYFEEAADGGADVTVSGNEIRLRSSAYTGRGYIFTLSSGSNGAKPIGTIRINNDNAYTSATSVTLSLSAADDTGVTGYYLSTSATAPSITASGWIAVSSAASFSASVPYTLSGGDGSKTVYVWYRDRNGNISDTASDSIILDTTLPSVAITNPTKYPNYNTTSGTINLGGSSSDTSSGVMRVTWENDRGGSGTASGTTSWSISGIGLMTGKNVITVTARDRANNTNTATINIYLTATDTSAPLCSIRINNDDAYTNTTSVTLSLSATDDTGVTGYYLSTSATAPSITASGWIAVSSAASFSASVPYTLSGGDGSKTVYVWYRDAAGNISDAASDSIILDMTGPSVAITSPTRYPNYNTTRSTINLGGSSSDTSSGVMRVTWENDRGGSGTASGTTSWSISGISLMTGKNVITVTARDRANNTNTATINIYYQ